MERWNFDRASLLLPVLIKPAFHREPAGLHRHREEQQSCYA